MLFNRPSKRNIADEVIFLEDFIPQRLQDDVEKLFLSNFTPWYTDGDVWGKEYIDLDKTVLDNKNIIDSTGFHHMVYYDQKPLSEHFLVCNSILYFLEMKMNIKIKDILRIRARLTTQTQQHNYSSYCGPHVDFLGENDYYSFVYYVHDTDGDTFVFDETVDKISNNPGSLSDPKILKRFTPKKGSAIFFTGDIFHAGNCPIKEKLRVVLNYDIKISKK